MTVVETIVGQFWLVEIAMANRGKSSYCMVCSYVSSQGAVIELLKSKGVEVKEMG